MLLVVAIGGPASAQDSTKAAEYFALAQSAERRHDWRAAIKNYEQAYQASPHPNVLYNIGINYQRLGELRQAAGYLRKYVQGAPNARDRDQVMAQVRQLRQRPSRVELSSTPPGATIYIDGKALGKTPLTAELDAGGHSVYALQDGTRSQARKLVLEYGEPAALDFVVGARPGQLSVSTKPRGAEVRIDGNLVGHAPYSGTLPAGKHTVLISAPGYLARRRVVAVPSEGSEQVREELQPTAEKAAAIRRLSDRSTGVLLGIGIGLSTGTGDSGSGRALLQGGIRSASNRWDLLADYGNYGAFVSAALGAEFRFYIAGHKWRPYVRGGLAVAIGGGEQNDPGGFGVEGGIGIRATGRPDRNLALEYFAEANMQIAKVNTPETASMPAPTAVVGAPLGVVRLQFPITIGIALRFGGGIKNR